MFVVVLFSVVSTGFAFKKLRVIVKIIVIRTNRQIFVPYRTFDRKVVVFAKAGAGLPQLSRRIAFVRRI